MAERLTKFNKTGWVLKLDEPQNEFEARQQLMSKFKLACEKLGKIEDILEKYGIESVEELEKKLADSDTWKRACELACRHIAEIEWFSCPETDDIKESGNEIAILAQQSLYYFFQQAKKGREQNETSTKT